MMTGLGQNHDLVVDWLGEADLSAAHALSTAVGWNQTRDDWQRLLRVSPRGCFAGRVDGRLIGTATVVEYPPSLGWIGMVIVDSRFRGSGHGKSLLLHAMNSGREDGIPHLGLDATDDGRRVYLRHEFHGEVPVVRWGGVLTTPRKGEWREWVRPCQPELERICALDRVLTGVDRGRLLRDLGGSAEVTGWVLASPHGDGSPEGFGFLRPGRETWHLGPLVGLAEASWECLLDAAAIFLAGQPVIADAVGGEAVEVALRNRGLSPRRHLTRMIHPHSMDVLGGPCCRLGAGFEWG